MSNYVRHVKRFAKPIGSRLGRINIELTERCNNNCIHCCINRPAADADALALEMSTSQIEDILIEAAGLGCLEVRFTGGEPLLHPDFEELYLFSRRLGLRVLLFTNARMITPYLAELFARIPPKAMIEVTVYGMRPESYEAVTRTPDSFPQFWRGVELLWEHQVPFIVKYALLPPNRAEVKEFEAWAKTIPWMKKSPGYSLFFDLRNRRDDDRKNKLIESLRLTPEEGLTVLTRDEAKYRMEMAVFASKFMGPPGDALFRCGAGHGLCIDAYGRAQPCMGVRAHKLTYDVIKSDCPSPLRMALDRFSDLCKLRAKNADYLKRCAMCFLKGLCEQCPAKSWTEHGTLDTPVEYLCQVAHEQARWLGWLGETEYGWEVKEWRKRVYQNSIVNETGTPFMTNG